MISCFTAHGGVRPARQCPPARKDSVLLMPLTCAQHQRWCFAEEQRRSSPKPCGCVLEAALAPTRHSRKPGRHRTRIPAHNARSTMNRSKRNSAMTLRRARLSASPKRLRCLVDPCHQNPITAWVCERGTSEIVAKRMQSEYLNAVTPHSPKKTPFDTCRNDDAMFLQDLSRDIASASCQCGEMRLRLARMFARPAADIRPPAPSMRAARHARSCDLTNGAGQWAPCYRSESMYPDTCPMRAAARMLQKQGGQNQSKLLFARSLRWARRAAQIWHRLTPLRGAATPACATRCGHNATASPARPGGQQRHRAGSCTKAQREKGVRVAASGFRALRSLCPAQGRTRHHRQHGCRRKGR